MTESDVEELRAAFQRLDSAMAKAAPKMFSQLNPGASDEEILVLRSALGGKINQPLEEWFSWHNGAESYGVSLLPLGYPLSIEQALSKLEQSRDIPFNSKIRRNSLKILDDFSGDGYFVDLRSQSPWVFYDMIEDSGGPIYAHTLTELVSFIASCFEEDVFFEDAQGNFEYDEEAYSELDDKFSRSATRL